MNLGIDRTSRRTGVERIAVPGLRALWSDRRAVSATEFALLLPFMLLLLIGMEIVTGALNQDRKISRVASSITDLVAQEQTVATAGLDAVMKIGDAILAPYTTDDLEVIVASVTFDKDGNPSVVWSRNNSSGTPWSAGSEPPITLPDTIAVPFTSIVVGQTNLAYNPPFSNIYSNLAGIFSSKDTGMETIDLSDTYYLRPRLTDTVRCDDCPNS